MVCWLAASARNFFAISRWDAARESLAMFDGADATRSLDGLRGGIPVAAVCRDHFLMILRRHIGLDGPLIEVLRQLRVVLDGRRSRGGE
jgi:hypothetical protein